MIDIHSHIIFGVDDGPRHIDDSLLLLKEAYNQGIRKIIATSHRREKMFETSESQIKKNFLVLKEKAKEILPDLELFYGAEIYYHFGILEKIENKIFPSLADSQYILVEFSSATSFREIFTAVDRILLLGYKPVIAHIERYNIFEQASHIETLIKKGAYIQVNASSIKKIKLFGDREKILKKRAKYLLDNHLIHFIASDMHNLTSRKPLLKEAYTIIEKKYGIKMAEELCVDNPEKLLNNIII